MRDESPLTDYQPYPDAPVSEDDIQRASVGKRNSQDPSTAVQTTVPQDRSLRDSLRRATEEYIERRQIVAPLGLEELRQHAARIHTQTGVDSAFLDYITILVSNEAWKETVAQIPYNRRLLLLPQCLRVHEACPAASDELGLLCEGCGQCCIGDLTVEAERLGYAVLVAEGSAVPVTMIETGQIEAIIGVSCMNALEKCFPHIQARAVPGLAVPLLQNGCVNTAVDVDRIREMINLISEDRTYRLNLDAVRREVRGWFTAEALDGIMGPASGQTEGIARGWLAAAGKRWRPDLTVCVSLALLNGAVRKCQCGDSPDDSAIPQDLKRLAVAVECFHKASLVHDDIEDDDEERYGEKTLHAVHGVPVALNVGDFLLGEGYRLIGELDVDPQVKVEMLRTAARGHLTLSRGQGAELCWARNPGVLSSAQVLEILQQKTAPAFEVALRLGALYGGAENDVHEVLGKYSTALGIAYQIRDDLEDFAGEGDSNDLRDMRPSLILAIACERLAGDPRSELILSLWNRTCDYDSVVDEVQRLIADCGAAAAVEDLLDSYTQQAIQLLRTLANPTLKGLLRRVVGKIFHDSAIKGYCSESKARNAAGGELGAEPAA